jgi:hypothetical protein
MGQMISETRIGTIQIAISNGHELLNHTPRLVVSSNPFKKVKMNLFKYFLHIPKSVIVLQSQIRKGA